MLAGRCGGCSADRRADAFVSNFAGQWLFLRNLEASVPVQSIFPDFDDSLRQAFRRETELFFDSIVREDRSALDLLRADYTFLNERLARHYGIPNVKGSHFRRVALGEGQPARRPARAGQHSDGDVVSGPDVAGRARQVDSREPARHAAAAAAAQRRRPEADGRLRRRALDAAAHGAASREPGLRQLPLDDGSARPRRSRTSTRSASGARSAKSSAPIDASGALPDGTRFEGPAGLREALLSSDRFVATLTEKMLTYALGRGLEYYDAPAVRAILRDAARDDYRFSSLIAGVVQSTPFRMRRASESNAVCRTRTRPRSR